MTAEEEARKVVKDYLKILSDVNPLEDYFNAAIKCALKMYIESRSLVVNLVNSNELSVVYGTTLVDRLDKVIQEIKKL
jgi:predicted peroxiredoxin